MKTKYPVLTIAKRSDVTEVNGGYSLPHGADRIRITNVDKEDVNKLEEILKPYGFIFMGGLQ